MAQRTSFSIFSRTRDDNELFVWTHLWRTTCNREIIEKILEEKNIAVILDHESGDPLVIVPTSKLDSSFIVVRKIFEQMSDGMKSVKRTTPHTISDTEIANMSENFEKMGVGVYRGFGKSCLWFVGDTIVIDNIDAYLKNTCFDLSLPKQELKYSANENDSSIENSYEHIEVPLQITLNHDEQAIIWLNDLYKFEHQKSHHLHVEYDRFDVKMSVFDPSKKDEIEKEVKEKIALCRSALAQKKFSFSSPMTLEFISRQEVHKFIDSKVNLFGKIQVVWFQEGNTFLKAYARDYDTLESGVKTIKTSVKEDSLPVPANVFKSSNLKEQLKAVEASFHGTADITLSPKASTIHIRFTSDNDTVYTKIKNLFVVVNVYLMRDRQSNCKRFFKKVKQVVENKYAVELSEDCGSGDYKWILKGEDRTILRTIENELANLEKSIISRAKTFITDETKDTVLAKLHNIDEASECAISSTETFLHNEQSKDRIDLRDRMSCRTWTLSRGTTVKLQNCNLRQMSGMMKNSLVVDVLPAREGVSEVNIQPGNVCLVATLRVPVWRDNKNKEKETFGKQVMALQSIISTDESKYSSLHFDLADVGKVNWPVRKYIKVILAVFIRKKSAIPIHFYEPKKDIFEEITIVIEESNTRTSSTDNPKASLKITVEEGELAKQRTDVIVNSAHKTLQLHLGAISNSILHQAGPRIQDECNSHLNGGAQISYTEVVVTNPYNLYCKLVFHGTLQAYKDDKQKILEKFVRKCLTEAEKCKMRTIAFPALGTGNLAHPADIVAKQMFDTVEKFASDNLVKSLTEVLFIIYPKDTSVVQAFKKEQTNRQNQRASVTWKETTVTSPQSIAYSVAVVGANIQTVENTLKEIKERLSKKETCPQLLNEEPVTMDPDTSFAAPQEQKIDRDETVELNTSNKQMSTSESQQRPPKTAIRDTELDSSIYNTFAPDDNVERYAEKPQNEMCKIVFKILNEEEENPYEFILRTLGRYKIKEDNIIWSEHNSLQARVRLESEEVADMLIRDLKNKGNYEIEKNSPDAVCNIRAKLHKSTNAYLQNETIRQKLVRQSGVGIVQEETGDEIILTGDLIEISTARDILLRMIQDEQEDANGQRGRNQGYRADNSNLYNKAAFQDNNTSTVKAEGDDVHQTSTNGQKVQTYSEKVTHNQATTTTGLDESNKLKAESQNKIYPQLHTTEKKPADIGLYPNLKNVDQTSERKTFENSKGAYPKNTKQPNHDSKHDKRFQTPPTANNESVHYAQVRKENVYAKNESIMMVTTEGIKVYVYQANICHLGDIDCIVNSTDSTMTNTHGVSAGIAKEAGDTMIKECHDYVQKHKKLHHDKVCITSPGKMLHYKKVMHVNAPRWSEDMKKKDFTDFLSSAVTICLLKASKADMVSVALPTISSGHGKAPPEAQFTAYPKGVIDFSRKYGKNTSIKEIHFVDIVKDANDYVKAAFLYASPDSHPTWKDKIMSLPSKAIEIFKPHIRSENQAGKYLEYFYPDKKLAVIACDSALLKALTHSHVKNIAQSEGFGEWTYNETGVIITEDVQLSGKSQSSKKCLERGGASYRKSYNSLRKVERNVGSAIGILGDEKFEFNHVLFVFMPSLNEKVLWRNSEDQNKFFNAMNTCLRNSLVQAERMDVKHLAMPVLGLDMYDIKAEWFLRCCISNMIIVIKEFAALRKRKEFMIIHIVVNGDEKVFQILHKEMHERNIETQI